MPLIRAADPGEATSSLKLSCLRQDDTEEMLYEGSLNGIPVAVNVNSGASHVFMFLDTARYCGLDLEEDRSEVKLGDSSKTTVQGTVTAELQVSGAFSTERIYVLQGPDNHAAHTVIVGRNWLRRHEPLINWRTRELNLKREDGKTYLVGPKSYSNVREKIQISHTSLKKMKKMELTDITEQFKETLVNELPSQLPRKRDVDFEIKLKSDEPPPVRPVISLSVDELKELKKQLQKLLQKGLFARAYHQMRIREEDCEKPDIRTRFGSFEWRVLCFGLTNAPAPFNLLFLDDVLLYSKSIQEHRQKLRILEVDFLGYRIIREGVHTQKRIINAITEWPEPSSIKEQDGHPVSFMSHRPSEAENNWDTGDQELLGFIVALREWDVYLRGRKFEFHKDHEPIRYLQSKARLIGRKERWLDELQSYDYDVIHIPGKQNVVADALSRRSDHIQLKAIRINNGDLHRRIISGYTRDEWSQTIINSLRGSPSNGDSRYTRRISLNTYSMISSLKEYFHGQAHLGKEKVFKSVAVYAYWPHMYRSIETYVSTCQVCQRNKTPNMNVPGHLQPLVVPDKCWQQVTTDFVTKFSKSRPGNDTVLVIVDRLSKLAIFIPTNENVKATTVYQLFQDHMFSKHGVPLCIISDRDPKFNSKYWKSLAELTNVSLNMSTRDHPQTDGQSEDMIRTLSNMIRGFIQKAPQDWDTVLSCLEYEYNCAKHKTTELAPFEIDVGRVPGTPFTRSRRPVGAQYEAAIQNVERRKAFTTIARDNIAHARADEKHYADKKRRDVQFEVGDLYLGPLSVLEVKGPVTYRIELPPSLKRAHNVFHVSKLKKYQQQEGQNNMEVIIDGDGTVQEEVQEIMDKKKEDNAIWYLVRFYGDEESEAIWMPKQDLRNYMDLVNEYERARKKLTRSSNSKSGRVKDRGCPHSRKIPPAYGCLVMDFEYKYRNGRRGIFLYSVSCQGSHVSRGCEQYKIEVNLEMG
ncbi:unnamed protein product [Chondrus crispus]|uniref:Reverse transcriptase n=1 Tax=Chondrus crispus TaxID=2769 RepID=R7QCC2_CHOCR|nr:unnamed protein product [Chondrus crispus]CDF35428.1 unnamed protein product [Chondrus crispus]|eukprot:XP_005715247.1 unnamed protein product [Chondrus crispus]